MYFQHFHGLTTLKSKIINNFKILHIMWGTAVAQWLRCCARNRKVAGSIPAGVSGFFIDIKSFRSASTQPLTEKADNLTTILCRCHEIWEP